METNVKNTKPSENGTAKTTATPKVEAKTETTTVVATEEKPSVESKLTETQVKIRRAFKKVYSVGKGNLMFRSATGIEPKDVPAQNRGKQVYAAGTVEAQRCVTETFYAGITGKIIRNSTEEKEKLAINAVKEFVETTTVKGDAKATLEKQKLAAQATLDKIMEIFKGEKLGGAKKTVTALTLEDIFA